MKTLRLAAATALVSSVFALSASAAESEWWDVTFESASFQANFPGLTIGELGTLTNDEDRMAAGTVQPYASGVWSAVDSDESYVTNGLATNFVNGAMTEVANTTYLKLDTQGNDLTWTPDATLVSNNVQTLVDADLYLVGSDSAPTDFDTAGDVQAAIYLKNETDNDTQETTNSVLCLYVWDSNLNEGQGGNIWVDLAGAELTDQSWAHIQVKVDHSDPTQPMVSVRVGNTQMYAVGDATATNWPAANVSAAKTAGRISSVAFRGTGAVDNFVGKTVAEEEIYCTFQAEVYFDNNANPENSGIAGNTTRILTDRLVGTPALFEGFTIDDYEYDELHDEETPATYGLTKIEIYNATGATMITNFNYTYNDGAGTATPDFDDSAYVAFSSEDNSFSVTVPTAGAPDGGDVVLAKIYFTHLNQPQVVVEPVDPGDSMSAVEKAQYVPAGVVTETDDQTGVTTTSFVVHFKGVAGVTYELLSSTTLTLTEAEWKAATVEDTVVCTSANEDDVLELKVELDPNDTAKFFKIGASATQP